MSAASSQQILLDSNRQHWQTVLDHLDSVNADAAAREKIERLALASPYALQHLHREPELIEHLLRLDEFALDTDVIDSAADKVDLDQVKQQLRLYRHRKLVEIIFLDVVAGASVPATLRYLSDLADQIIAIALEQCSRQLSAKHGQPLDSDGEPMTLNIIASPSESSG